MTTTIVVSPLGRQPDNTGEVIKLDILVNDPTFFATYDKIEVWRSTLGQGGPYSELTAVELLPARIPDDPSGPPAVPVTGAQAVVVGEDLDVIVNGGTLVRATFTGSDPLTYAQVATQITAQGQAKVTAYVSSTGKLILQTTGAGTGVSILVDPTDAAARLGLLMGEIRYGRDPRLNLISGVNRYTFEDLFGNEEFHYRIRFRNSVTGAVSEHSLPHSVGARVGIDSANLICGKADLIQANGKPLINQEVHLHSEFNGSMVDGRVMVGTDLSKLTDAHGHVEFMLVRGQRFGVSIPGTSLFRTITVPTDTAREVFNLFDPDIADEDIFKVQVPELIVAERRSL